MRSLLIYILLTHLLLAEATPPKREMRAVWLATVANIDFPRNTNSSVETQKKEICDILDQHKADGINAVFFQVRPSADAFYQSDIEPWSRYLCGSQGKAPSPLYDPLSFIISEAHKRNMELHAWINPFRVRLKRSDKLCSNHPYTEHPEWGWEYAGKTYFDPGIPSVREHTQKVITDITHRYDIDGIHLDDYFYPYIVAGHNKLPDADTFKKYGGIYYPKRIEDWRRNNINLFIKNTNALIKKEKAWVKFGVSPFGIWKNSTSPTDELPTKSTVSTYDMLYADVVKWMKEGWIDYCAPQLYWAIGFKQADYAKLLAWWDKHSYGRNIYVGHSLYKIDSASKEVAWRSPLEIERQIVAMRASENFSGSAFYSSKHLIRRDDVKPLRKALNEDYYKYEALMPKMPWIDNKAPNPPRSVKFESPQKNQRISWQSPKFKNEMDEAHWYIIYKTDINTDPKTILKAENIVSRTKETHYIIPREAPPGRYAITALDRLHNESKPRVIDVQQKHMSSIVFSTESKIVQLY